MGLFDWLSGSSAQTSQKKWFERIEDARRYAGRVNNAGEYIAHDGYNWGADWGRSCHDCMFQSATGLDGGQIGCYLLAERGQSRDSIRQFQSALSRNSAPCPDYGMVSFDSSNPSDTEVRVTIRRIAMERGWDAGDGIV
jgi:hypothetical protein